MMWPEQLPRYFELPQTPRSGYDTTELFNISILLSNIPNGESPRGAFPLTGLLFHVFAQQRQHTISDFEMV